MKRKLMLSAARISGTVAVVICAVWIGVAQPTFRGNHASGVTVDPERLKAHVRMLSRQLCPRDWEHTANLDQCADYIAQHFRQAGAIVEFQVFDVHGKQYRNVIGRIGMGKGSKVVVGAHYDAGGEDPGADDNASGIAAIIELAYLLGRAAPSSEVEVVAYVLEEPPFFRTKFMGSAIHAKSLADQKANISGIIVLEMVGCFRDAWGSQSYPTPLFRLIYPGRANFIAVAGRWDQGSWIKKVKTGMKGTTGLPVYSIRAPSVIPGIDFSDHLNYWPYGYKALMITDTAFYRNKAYHLPGDTPDQLDYIRMASVVVAVYEAIESM